MKILWALVALSLLHCKGNKSEGTPSSAASSPVSLNGSGASFPNPLYAKWISQYAKVDPSVKINYQAVGSGAGIKAVTDRTVDFGASDSPMTDEQIQKSGPVLHIPTTLGAVVLAYNVNGVQGPLLLSASNVAGIFLGEIKSWDDPKLLSDNPSQKLPKIPISVAFRSDGSGTTAVFTDFLSKASPAWKERVGTGTSVKWPVGVGANKNDGVTNQIKTTPGAIGYIELAFAKQNNLPVASVRNRAGKFVAPTPDSVTQAAAAMSKDLPEDLRISITDPEGDEVYPISAFSYVLLPENTSDPARGVALAKFLRWAIHEGQAVAPSLDYAPLPPDVVKKTEARLARAQAGGAPALR